MPTTYRRRPTPCRHCGDAVLIGESAGLKLFGIDLRMRPKVGVMHADPGPGGEVFDPVDEGCRRPPVAR
jgi:hypothetical protein